VVWIGFGLDVAWLRRCHVACGMEIKLLSFTLDFTLSEFCRFVVGSAGVAVRLETLMSR